ncbi:hypothetical protein GWO13_02290, partial [Candidatus Bathyarchaeota archaeon]|nr:hypothetical protein [Candidatus Bathyarchaeota archaeon]
MDVNRLRNYLSPISIVIGILALAGCPSFSGGGWIFSACDQNPAFFFPFTCAVDSTAKATFGFDLNCDDGTGFGELQYRDHGVLVTGPDLKERKLSIHGEVNNVRGPCVGGNIESDGFGGSYTGTYTPQPPTMGAPGTFEVIVVDTGQLGPNKGDLIGIQLFGGVFDGYSNGVLNGKELQGGNIALQE